MKALVTGFDPFGGDAFNPSSEAVRRFEEESAQENADETSVERFIGRAGVSHEEADPRGS